MFNHAFLPFVYSACKCDFIALLRFCLKLLVRMFSLPSSARNAKCSRQKCGFPCTSKGTQLVLPALEPESCSRVPSFVCKVFTPRLQGRFFVRRLVCRATCHVPWAVFLILCSFFFALHSFVCMVLLCSPKSHSVFCTLFSERMNVVLQVFVYCFCFAYTCDCTGHIVWN